MPGSLALGEDEANACPGLHSTGDGNGIVHFMTMLSLSKDMFVS